MRTPLHEVRGHAGVRSAAHFPARTGDGLCRSSMCKPGDWNLGGVMMVACRRASGVWEEKESVGEGAPTADGLVKREGIPREAVGE